MRIQFLLLQDYFDLFAIYHKVAALLEFISDSIHFAATYCLAHYLSQKEIICANPRQVTDFKR